MKKYIVPEVLAGSFTCPHCYAISQQTWWVIDLEASNFDSKPMAFSATKAPLRVGKCTHCGKNTIWLNERLLYPASNSAPEPNPQMPDDVLRIYNEAAATFSASPRAAAALLRLALQILCGKVGGKGENINQDIAILVKNGLPDVVQQSLDIVRVTGNDAVHPGKIDADSAETVSSLFELINIIVEYMIAMPKKVSGIYSQLPANKLQGIEERDSKE